nr:antitoxin [Streptomyces sp. TP-A0356]
MSMMDKLKQLLKGHESHADKGIDKGADAVGEKAEGPYSGQVDKGPDALREQFRQDRDNPPQP